MTLVETLLDKPGGYLRNDVAPPGVWLDNMPAWSTACCCRSGNWPLHYRPCSMRREPTRCKPSLRHDSRDWLYPGTEKSLAQARDAPARLAALTQPGTGFAADGGGLAQWLDRVAVRLDTQTEPVGERRR
ncbi:DUF2333 family protein [Billgrantia gudaonensis]|uniref:DUF2333 family protein n=1 Tax=Billgrantia gudaonensis TaxID=376427 RepID=A0A3S0QS19_9GAMM|nr:DUF2333 family protein [Halomonas gudaonensis]